MLNFTYCNPTEIVFGKNTIGELASRIAPDTKVLMIYGGGSIQKNGVYEQVRKALEGREVLEFAGIEPNPRYETCMKAVELARKENVDMLLAVGGGSVIDAAKFIAAAARYQGDDPWDFMPMGKWDLIESALPFATVLTLPATGSEMNNGSVITRELIKEKIFFISPHTFPKFSILDPETTFTLPERQTANGIVDSFVHVTEQYMTCDVNSPLQDRQAEAVMLTLIEEGPKAMADPKDYDARANLMWCSTQAFNGLIGCGVAQDWAVHWIGHELTALYGIDHARTLAVVLPGVYRHQRDRKRARLLKYAERVWGVTEGDEDARIEAGIAKTEAFFHSLGIGTKFGDYDIPRETCKLAGERMAARNMIAGEHQDLGPKEVEEILSLCI